MEIKRMLWLDIIYSLDNVVDDEVDSYKEAEDNGYYRALDLVLKKSWNCKGLRGIVWHLVVSHLELDE